MEENEKATVKTEARNSAADARPWVGEKLRIDRPIVVEGRYDKEKLLSFVSGNVITTDGFGIFSKKEKLALIRRLARGGGIILLTDSDGAGGVIRSYITSSLPAGSVTQLYIPQIKGKERRKKTPSRAGTLGVEGIDTERLYKLLLPFSRGGRAEEDARERITKGDFYEDGLSGCDGAEARRDLLALKYELPKGMTANALLAAVNVLSTREEYKKTVSLIGKEAK